MCKVFIQRRKPELMIALPRLLARIHPHSHKHKEMKDLLYRVAAGYAGEVKVDKYLESINFPKPFYVFTDLQLAISPKFAVQIDTLILTPSNAFILEIKNIAGTLNYIANPPHFECTYEEKKSIVIDCPLMQLNNNKNGLDIWIEGKGFSIQSKGMIVMANSNTLVKNAPSQMTIMYAKHLPHYFRTMIQEKAVLTNQQFHSLVEQLKRNQTIYNPYPLCERFRIDPSEIKTGSLCSTCNIELNRMNNLLWTCFSCGDKFKQPYIQGLTDWFMLMKSTISNEECRTFFHLKSKYAANYILKSSSLKQTGNSTATIYKWDYKTSPSNIKKKNRKQQSTTAK